MPAKIAGFFTFKNCLSCSTQAKCFTLYLFLSRLSNQRFVRFAHAPVRSLTAPQRRLTTVAAKARRFRLHPVFVFSRLSNQRFVRFAHAPVRSLTAPQRRLTTVAAKARRFRLHPVFVFLVPLLHKTFSVLFRFG